MNDAGKHIKHKIIHSLFFMVQCLMVACSSETHQSLIAVNLVGYNADQVKQALLVNFDAEEFEILRLEDMESVFRASVGPEKPADLATNDRVSILDFTVLEAKGEYLIQVSDSAGNRVKSGSFRISDDIYSEVAITSLQSFYYQRCGTSVKNHNTWEHDTCHTDDAIFYYNPSHGIDVTGGWHDAGDYNKFSVNTAFSAALLLYLYELNPGPFYDGQLSIPESSNGIPDIMDEVSWALRWLLKMQDSSSGGVFHKISQKQWIGEFLPSDDGANPRYIFEISSTATADFAAVTAIGARLLLEFEPAFSKKLEEASLNAWRYLEQRPVIQPLGGFKNPSDVMGGEYGDDNDSDERQWAAIELYKLTKNAAFIEYFIRHYNPIRNERLPVLSWQNVHVFAYHSFLRTDMPENYNRIRNELRDYLIRNADAVLKKQERNNYMNLISHTEYYWGSNSVGLGYTYELIQAYRLTKEEKYNLAALDQLHYVLGRNPFGISMVTGIGCRSVQHPYHQLSIAGNHLKPVPGMLVGGPNNHSHIRRYFRNRVISKYPGKNYEDRYENYLVNEVAINFTAVFLYAAGSQAWFPNI